MDEFIGELNSRLDEIRGAGLYRELRRVDSPQSRRVRTEGEWRLNFSSNDYLGLANHPRLIEATIEATRKYGAGSGASRLICGSLEPHHELESALADFKGSQAALVFSSGYAAALGTICALAGKDDVVVLDKRVHASIVDAARLSGAKLRVFAHNDLNDLEVILRWADQRVASASAARRRRTLVVTESVFSMDGDSAPLREIVALKNRFGAWLMVDEAHASGLYGPNRRGLAEELRVSDQIEIQMGTLGKALGSAGGFICGPRALIEYLVNRARSFIFSTAPTPGASAAARAAMELIQTNEGAERRDTLWRSVERLKRGLQAAGWRLPEARGAIIPLVIGAEDKAVAAASALGKRGICLPAIRFPTVARGTARLRLTLTADHTPNDIAELLTALSETVQPAAIPHE